MTRRDKINYYLDIAETVAERGTCLRRNFGAIIVKNDQIVSTGAARAAARTAPTWATAPATAWVSRAGSAMSSAVRSTPK